MNFYEQELRKLTGTFPSKISKSSYIGRACLIPLSKGRVAKLQFATCGMADNYEALSITIIDAQNGEIDSNKLLFKDYFAPQMRGGGSTVIPHIWSCNGIDSWYKAPTALEFKSLGKAAHEYIGIFS